MQVSRLFGYFLLSTSLFIAAPDTQAQTDLRGGNIDGGTFSESTDLAYVQRLRDAGASVVRLFFLNSEATTDNETQYRAWLQDEVYPRMAQLVELFANQMGFHVVLSIHIAPGGRNSATPPVDLALIPGAEHDWKRQVLVDAWTTIAAQYNSMGDKVSYQLFSEPAPPSDKSAWKDIQKRIIDAIRGADSTPEEQQPRIYFMTEYGTPSKVRSINTSAGRGKMGVMFNMYHPHDYTHQGTPASKTGKSYSYPGCVILGKKANKKSTKYKSCTPGGIADSLKQFNRFAKKNKLEKLSAELAVSRFAPKSDKYLNDVFRILKKQKIGWIYYTFIERGDSPWRLDCTDASTMETSCVAASLDVPSTRQQILEKYFNQLQ